MACFKFSAAFTAQVEGSYNGILEIDGSGMTASQLREEARSKIEEEIEETLSNAGTTDVDISGVNDINLEDLEREICKCSGLGFTLTTLDEGAGLMKASPCPTCQRVPNTVESCKAALAIMEEKGKELEEEGDE